MLSDEKVAELLRDDTPGQLTNIDGSPRTQVYVSPKLASQRREATSKMLMAGHSIDRIIEVMGREYMLVPDPENPGKKKRIPGFGLSAEVSLGIINEVRKRWKDEDEEEAPYRRAAAIRRNKSHIEKAASKGQYGAVAALEANLSKMEGTHEAVKIEVSNVGRELDEALVSVLGELDPEVVQDMVAMERARLIDTDGEPVK